ncbi:ADP-dependent glucokinase [Cimex lectularius]|uniref:ADP-dependent glucokinase n=1 Tax=Cimex lectularius TaxID=79782 RepID=A0A8I6R6N1_CIMLE|nr:ADP-dependent glucokinase [Cimex lectularius]
MGLTDIISVGTAFSVACVLLSIYLRDPEQELRDRLVNVINGLIHVEDRHIKLSPKVLVGYGGCVDLYVRGGELFTYRPDIGEPRHFDGINTIDELERSYAYYFQHGAATERYTVNSTLFDSLIERAEKLPTSYYTIGGNAPVMAMRLFREGCQVILASTISEKHRNNIPKGIKVVGEAVKRDDIHLILEYKSGENWGPYKAPRANRYILHNDVHNPALKTLEYLDDPIKSWKPDLFVVSGLQLMDNFVYPEGFRTEKIKRIHDQIQSLPKSTKVHFEMASFTELALLMDMKNYVIPFSDSLGMNEQELANLYSIYQYGNISLVTDSTPRVGIVLDQMRYIFKKIRKTNTIVPNSKILSRIHIHTLAYQAIMTEINSNWKHTEIAAAKASLTAFRHTCASSEVDANKAAVLMDESFSRSVLKSDSGRIELEPSHPVPCWKEGNVLVCVAAGVVCTNVEQTAGGGDNISAAALAIQL